MTSSTLIDRLTIELERGISLLERLHVLSQTEALALETSSVAELRSIVAAKEDVVHEIRQTETHVTAMLGAIKPLWFDLQSDTRQSLRKLQDRAFLLMGRISQVEETNRSHLERLKGEFATSLRILGDDQKLNATYSTPVGQPPRFSRLVD